MSAKFLLQLLCILITCRCVGWIGRKYLGQPQVVGEMIAGVILGPSLFGLLAPAAQAYLFPAEAKSTLYVCSQLAVGLYMFIVGLDFDKAHFKQSARSASMISLSGMLGPTLVAILITPLLLSTPGLFAASASQLQATLFMVAAIAITAFPMLARIIHENGLSNTRLGTLSLSAGAIDDAAAWCLLAIVLASFSGSFAPAVATIVGGVFFAYTLIVLGPRLLGPLERWVECDANSTSLLAVTLIAFLAMATLADTLGLHTVFGGFLLGAVMPRGKFSKVIKAQLEPITVVLLLPIFFTYSGLNTQLALLFSGDTLLIALLILVSSILAKLGACWAAARLSGQDNRTALAVGALMNSRGLMELIIINIGLQAGLIGPELFSMLTLMAIITTLIASPLFNYVYRNRLYTPEPALGN